MRKKKNFHVDASEALMIIPTLQKSRDVIEERGRGRENESDARV